MKEVKELSPLVVYTPSKSQRAKVAALKARRLDGEQGQVAKFWQHHTYHG